MYGASIMYMLLKFMYALTYV